LENGSPLRLESKIIEIQGLLTELIEIVENEEYLDDSELSSYKIAYDDLSHTLDKEVQYVLSAYSKIAGKNAPKIRSTEYQNELDKAINRLNQDLYMF